MGIELTLLLWSTGLFAAYVGVQSILYRMQHGIWFAGSARDSEAPPDKLSARAERALRNLLETYPAFVVLVVVVELADRSDALTVWGAHIYFWARWIYLPLYLSGVQYTRSLVWLAGSIGLVLMFVGILF
jgi:uncharacterized MAPEG superfamily protein